MPEPRDDTPSMCTSGFYNNLLCPRVAAQSHYPWNNRASHYFVSDGGFIPRLRTNQAGVTPFFRITLPYLASSPVTTTA